jgi:hypothetical protein
VSETIGHVRLVGVVLKWVDSQVSNIPGVCLYCDCPPLRVTEKPSSIDGFYPDVCVLTIPSVLTIIGEAKTLPDLESSRSFRQIVAFLEYLKVQSNPHFVLAVPWQASATARNILRVAKKEAFAEAVKLNVISDLPLNAKSS